LNTIQQACQILFWAYKMAKILISWWFMRSFL